MRIIDLLHYMASSDYDHRYHKASSLTINDCDIYSYAANIARVDFVNQKVIIDMNYVKYSATTSHHFAWIFNAFRHYEVIRTYGYSIEECLKRMSYYYKKKINYDKSLKEYIIQLRDVALQTVNYYKIPKYKYNTKEFRYINKLADKFDKELTERSKRLEERRQQRQLERERLEKEREHGDRLLLKNSGVKYDTYKDMFTLVSKGLILDEMDVLGVPCHAIKLDERRWLLSPAHIEKVLDLPKHTLYGREYNVDILGYEDGTFMTSRHVRLQDRDGSIKRLLKRFMLGIYNNLDIEAYKYTHVGPYTVGEITDKTISIGCHTFSFDNLKELYLSLKEENLI